MFRTITVVIALLFATSSLVHAEDRESSLLNLGYKHQRLQKVDIDMSTQEYEAIYRHNQRLVDKTLRSYSKDTLDAIGIPKNVGYHVGAALGLVVNDGTALNLNKSKTLGLEFKDVSKPQRALHFTIKLYW
jgi:hypothetical protein